MHVIMSYDINKNKLDIIIDNYTKVQGSRSLDSGLSSY